jgi:hypothetical protein
MRFSVLDVLQAAHCCLIALRLFGSAPQSFFVVTLAQNLS